MIRNAQHHIPKLLVAALVAVAAVALVACGGGAPDGAAATDPAADEAAVAEEAVVAEPAAGADEAATDDATTKAAAGAVEWGYAPGGPENWATLSPDYAVCASGANQSPVDIAGYQASDAPALSFSWGSGIAEIANDGKKLNVKYAPGSSFAIADRSYELAGAHWHSPSEHFIDGEQLPAEVHLVHQQSSGGLGVVGILYRLGEADPTVEALLGAAPAIGETAAGSDETHPALNASVFQPADMGYYSYPGSLTTPPCSEPVDWFVMHEIRTISQDQVDRLRAAIGGVNSRPVQPLNGREIAFSGSRPVSQ